MRDIYAFCQRLKLAFHVADTDTDTDTDILAMIVARMSASRSANHKNNFRKSRVGRVGEDPREDVRVGVGVGIVEFQLPCGGEATGWIGGLSHHLPQWPPLKIVQHQ